MTDLKFRWTATVIAQLLSGKPLKRFPKQARSFFHPDKSGCYLNMPIELTPEFIRVF